MVLREGVNPYFDFAAHAATLSMTGNFPTVFLYPIRPDPFGKLKTGYA
jgi:hypothetical protein